MNFIGIDPGAKGAIAVIDIFRRYVVYYATNDDDEKCSRINQALRDLANTSKVAIEDVTAMHLWGVSSTFTFGWATGYWHGVCDALQIPIILVKAKVWQAEISKPPEKIPLPKGSSMKKHNDLRKQILKEASMKAASQICGRKITHDGVADAICIAQWLRQQHLRGRLDEIPNEKESA